MGIKKFEEYNIRIPEREKGECLISIEGNGELFNDTIRKIKKSDISAQVKIIANGEEIRTNKYGFKKF